MDSISLLEPVVAFTAPLHVDANLGGLIPERENLEKRFAIARGDLDRQNFEIDLVVSRNAHAPYKAPRPFGVGSRNIRLGAKLIL